MLKLMYITNNPQIAEIAADAGVDRIFIDMEVLGKQQRQGNIDSVKSAHTPEDIYRVREAIGNSAQILARVNPLNPNSEQEIDASVENGADLIMLPMWRSAQDISRFLQMVGRRAKTMPLLETKEADCSLPEVLKLQGIDELLIGLNDLHLSYGRKFMFELLADGTVARLCAQMKAAGIPYGFGGVGRPGTGLLPAQYILAEHYRLGSGCVILSRSFCNTTLLRDEQLIRETFVEGIRDIRKCEAELAAWSERDFEENRLRVCDCVQRVIEAVG